MQNGAHFVNPWIQAYLIKSSNNCLIDYQIIKKEILLFWLCLEIMEIKNVAFYSRAHCAVWLEYIDTLSQNGIKPMKLVYFGKHLTFIVILPHMLFWMSLMLASVQFISKRNDSQRHVYNLCVPSLSVTQFLAAWLFWKLGDCKLGVVVLHRSPPASPPPVPLLLCMRPTAAAARALWRYEVNTNFPFYYALKKLVKC